jgi:hypothetical protein
LKRERNSCEVSVRKPEGKKPFGSVDVKIILK